MENEKKLNFEKLKFLYIHSGVNVASGMVFTIIIAFILNSLVPQEQLTYWVIANLGISFIGFLLLNRAKRLTYETSNTFNWMVCISFLLSGIFFGYIGIVAMQYGLFVHQAFVLLILGGLVSVAIGSYAVNLRLFLLYSLPMLTPMIVMLFMQENELQYLMGIVSLLFYLMMLFSAIRVNKSIVTALMGQFENEDLVKYLSDTKKRVESLNKNLKVEINERIDAQHDLELVTQRLTEAQRISSMGNFEFNLESKRLWFSRELYELHGLDNSIDMNLDIFFSVVDKKDAQLLKSLIDDCVRNRDIFSIDYKVILKNGDVRKLHVQTKMLKDEKRDTYVLAGAVQDVTAQRKKDDELFLAAKVFEGVHDAVIVTDNRFNILTVNSAFSAITGRNKEDVIGTSDVVLAEYLKDDKFVREFHDSITANGFWKGEMSGFSRKGENFTQRSNVSVVKNPQGQIIHYIELFSDITREKKAEERLRYLVHYDSLTDLPNRELLSNRLSKAVQKQKRNGKLVAILLFDMDNFKLVNDTLGHIAGDGMLRLVAQRLKSLIRESDTLSRLGGDEFCILLDDIENISIISAMAQKILSSFEAPFIIESKELFITVSIGISIYPENALDVSTLIKQADTAMYRAKDYGKNTYQFFTDKMDESSYERLMIEGHLRRALEDEELELYYQPKVELCTGKIVGAEALLRWNHPEMGMVSPDRFIAIAEDTGLIVPIGAWVMDEAISQTKIWIDNGHNKFHMAINVSGRQFKTESIIELVDIALKKYDVSSTNIEVELTESVLMDEKDKILKTLTTLRDNGISIAIDDFGTGYSSLSYLKMFPLTTLKIDKSFIDDLSDGSDDAEIVSATIKMAKSLNMKVVAEGVETVEQLNFLQKEHCDVIQGYYYSPPVPVHKFEELLKRGVITP